MPMITKIVQNQKKYDLYLDDHFFLTVNDDLLIEFQLIKGREISNSVVEKISAQQKNSEAYNLALNKLSYSMRSTGEIRQLLKQNKISLSTIDEVIDRLSAQNFLNDQLFAELYLKELIKTTHYGPKVIKQKMQQKMLPTDLIETVLLDFSENLQEEKIRRDFAKTIENKKLTGSLSKFIEKEKLKLVRWGYNLDLINQISSEFDLSALSNEEDVAIEKEGTRLIQKYEKLPSFERKQKIKQTLYRRGYRSELINSFLDRCSF
ncbi:RecX family transcriptional regulator [Xylocopilactobacillus apicola]|uniref:Regulatory protein RecX n=1 Tax=Xylocopilactobacillus apicola TaxID=2932184 RepID=A0AAU9DG02_9LACO|nr:RecX family transcriptional regulator [Xylocopilactobacillus apicola]BDR58875.1 regulatory protein RecX [Xylocopilactobacillus apicola]